MSSKWIYAFFSFFLVSSRLAAVHVSIVPNVPTTNAEFFKSNGGRDEGNKAFYLLKQRLMALGHSISVMESFGDFNGADYIIYFNYNEDMFLMELAARAVPVEKLFLFLWEPPSVDPFSYDRLRHCFFSRVYTWNDDLVDNQKYFKLYYPNLRKPMLPQQTKFSQKRKCTLIAGNKSSMHQSELYSQRQKAVDFFSKFHPDDLDLYGLGWSDCAAYRGTINDKATTLEKYRFCICYENITDINGYVTEKIFDCFYAGCVPVYWGASNIQQYIPSSCYIDRRKFKSNKKLYQFLNRMSKEMHQHYINNIKAYLESPASYVYTPEYFVDWFVESVLEI